MTTADFLGQHAYALVAAAAMIEGETALLVAGGAAGAGLISLPGVIAAAFAGSLAGDQACYWAGRRWGARWMRARPGLESRAASVLERLRRHEGWVLLSFRFWYGLRSVTPLAIGTAGIPFSRVIPRNAIGALLWSGLFASAGAGIGASLWAFDPGWAVLATPVVAVIAVLAMLRRRHGRMPAAPALRPTGLPSPGGDADRKATRTCTP